MRPHILYTDADQDRPDVICDGNGQVALSLCKVCGQAEAGLQVSCPGTPQEQALGNIRAKAELLLEDAAAAGVVLTIEQRPLRPLAMGHFESVVSVRPARPVSSYQPQKRAASGAQSPLPPAAPTAQGGWCEMCGVSHEGPHLPVGGMQK